MLLLLPHTYEGVNPEQTPVLWLWVRIESLLLFVLQSCPGGAQCAISVSICSTWWLDQAFGVAITGGIYCQFRLRAFNSFSATLKGKTDCRNHCHSSVISNMKICTSHSVMPLKSRLRYWEGGVEFVHVGREGCRPEAWGGKNGLGVWTSWEENLPLRCAAGNFSINRWS